MGTESAQSCRNTGSPSARVVGPRMGRPTPGHWLQAVAGQGASTTVLDAPGLAQRGRAS